VRGYYVAIEATSTSVLNDLRDAHNENHLKSLMGKKHQLPFSVAKRDVDVTQLFTSPDESEEPRIRLVLLRVLPAQLVRETTPSLHTPYPGSELIPPPRQFEVPMMTASQSGARVLSLSTRGNIIWACGTAKYLRRLQWITYT